MVTRRGFLARLSGLLATVIVAPELPTTPPPSLPPPLMFHKDAFVLSWPSIDLDREYLPYDASKFPPPCRLDVLYGVGYGARTIACRVAE